MPVKLINRLDHDTAIGLWEITESTDWLLSNIDLSVKELERLNHFRAAERKKQWLAYRHLLKHMTDKRQAYIEYDKNGKPSFMESNLHISVAHAGCYAAAITHRSTPVGIDVERVSARIQKVEDRFLSEEERSSIDPAGKLDKLCIYWCAKEALYKLHGQKGLDFREHLHIDQFPVNPHGELTGRIMKKDFNRAYRLHFMKIDDYYMVYVAGHE